jgi:hypothetical protein
MQTVSTIGLDIAKSVFQVHGVDANGLASTKSVTAAPSNDGLASVFILAPPVSINNVVV